MNYHKIEKTSIANGEGVRVVLWVSGCSLHCKGCHNPETWDYCSGKLFDAKAEQELFEVLNKPYIQGITFSGGHPLEDENVYKIYELVTEIKDKFPDKTIWLYTGYTWEQIMYPILTDNLDLKKDRIIDCRKNIVELCDVLVDGKYMNNLRDISLKFRGSSNQRIIDVPKSLKQNKVVLFYD